MNSYVKSPDPALTKLGTQATALKPKPWNIIRPECPKPYLQTQTQKPYKPCDSKT